MSRVVPVPTLLKIIYLNTAFYFKLLRQLLAKMTFFWKNKDLMLKAKKFLF
jgi:hypothetical protein